MSKMGFDYYTLEILLKGLLNSSFLASRTNAQIKTRKSLSQPEFTKHLRFEKHFMGAKKNHKGLYFLNLGYYFDCSRMCMPKCNFQV